ncbi:Valine--tRNA ligase [Frankliniella fusca]|uniref:Valine--tRNA ligase n=1 Tax=Frankliniella fusca TaxID=407009 RepID=A0AAE1I0J9_9NEOP|nr:Valine--tRNA ligase [Frankliniella fusca]
MPLANASLLPGPPGFVKLRRVQHVTSDDRMSTIAEDDDDMVDGLRVWMSGPRAAAAGRRTPRTPSPSPGRSTDSVISSDESLSWPSDGSLSRYEHEKRVPLEEFRARTLGYLRSAPDPRDLPRDCFQAVQTLRTAPVDPDLDDDEEAPPPRELHSEWYLMAHPFVVRFAHAFHQSLAAALGVPDESAQQAVLRVNNGPAGVVWERVAGAGSGAGGRALQLQHEAVAALALADWPAAAREWVWALACPAGERLLELSMSAPQAHAYLSLVAVLRAVPGINEALVRAFFMRHSESTPADVQISEERRLKHPCRPQSAASSLGWAPGRSLRKALAQLYIALRQQQLPDYFVTERNLLRELPHKQIVRAQERLFRIQEQLLYRVLQTCRRLVYVHGDDFYPRLQYDKLVALLADPDADDGSAYSGSSLTTPSHSLSSSASNSRRTSRNESFHHPQAQGQGQAALTVMDMNWANANRTRLHGLTSAPNSRRASPSPAGRSRSHDRLDSVDQKWIDELRRWDAEERRLAEAAATEASPKLAKHFTIKLGTSSPEARYRTQGLLKLFCDQFIEMGKTSIKFEDYSQAYVYLRHSLHLMAILEQDYFCKEDARGFLSRIKQAERGLTKSTIMSENVRTKPVVYGSTSALNLSSYNQQRQPKMMFGSTSVL